MTQYRWLSIFGFDEPARGFEWAQYRGAPVVEDMMVWYPGYRVEEARPGVFLFFRRGDGVLISWALLAFEGEVPPLESLL